MEQNIFERNISIGYSSTGTNNDWDWANFYANKVYITVEEEEIRGEVKMASGEIRTRYKKRRKIELEIPFFDRFNIFYNEEYPNYAIFETIINCPFLKFRWLGNDTENKRNKVLNSDLPYVINYAPYDDGILLPMESNKLQTSVYIAEKGMEFLDNHYARKIVKLTLMEKKNWYDTGQ